jgi:hypothetical protein
MEMKDIILSTLQEFEENESIEEVDNKREERNNYKEPSEQKLPPVKKTTGIEELQSIMNSVQNISDSQYKEEPKVIEAPAPVQQEYQEQINDMEIYQNAQIQQREPVVTEPTISNIIETRNTNTLQNQIENETKFLTSLRERILVIFEGLQSPNNRSLDAKVDLIINFLEYQLAMFDERLENLRKEL